MVAGTITSIPHLAKLVALANAIGLRDMRSREMCVQCLEAVRVPQDDVASIIPVVADHRHGAAHRGDDRGARLVCDVDSIVEFAQPGERVVAVPVRRCDAAAGGRYEQPAEHAIAHVLAQSGARNQQNLAWSDDRAGNVVDIQDGVQTYSVTSRDAAQIVASANRIANAGVARNDNLEAFAQIALAA